MSQGKTLILYTGGTIGMFPKDESDPSSPLLPAEWGRIKERLPALESMPMQVDLHSMTPIDSSDMSPDYWLDIAKTIGERYSEYEGFVILHGTDTLVYTAAALSFLLENLGKPIILTGAQRPIFQPESDAAPNLIASLKWAAPTAYNLPIVPEVCLFFGKALLRGNRARKVSTHRFSGFASPNFPPLGKAEENLRIDPNLILPQPTQPLRIHDRLDPNVLMFDLFPGLQPKALKHLLSTKGLKGAVMRTFGAGNAPTSEAFLVEIQSAVDRGISIVNITQCFEGAVEMGRYESSDRLHKIGVLGGGDMTPEAALVKLMFLLGQSDPIHSIKERMQTDLRGERTPPSSE